MSLLFWGSYKGSLGDVRQAIPLVDWNGGLDVAFEIGAGLNHPAAAHGDTALHVAARRGHSRVVRELINRGASHEVKNADRMTAYDVVRRVDTSKFKCVVDLRVMRAQARVRGPADSCVCLHPYPCVRAALLRRAVLCALRTRAV